MVQAVVEASGNQAADIFQVLGGNGATHLAVDGAGNLVVGSNTDLKEVILCDAQDKTAYSLRVTNGRLTLTRA